MLVELATRAFPRAFRFVPVRRRQSIRIARIELAFSALSFAATLLSLLAALLGALRIPPRGRLPWMALARLALALAFGTLGKSRVDGASEGISESLDRGRRGCRVGSGWVIFRLLFRRLRCWILRRVGRVDIRLRLVASPALLGLRGVLSTVHAT